MKNYQAFIENQEQFIEEKVHELKNDLESIIDVLEDDAISQSYTSMKIKELKDALVRMQDESNKEYFYKNYLVFKECIQRLRKQFGLSYERVER